MVEMKAADARLQFSLNGKVRSILNNGQKEITVTSDVVEVRVELPQSELANDNVLTLSTIGQTQYFGIKSIQLEIKAP